MPDTVDEARAYVTHYWSDAIKRAHSVLMAEPPAATSRLGSSWREAMAYEQGFEQAEAKLAALLMEHEPGADYGYEWMLCACGWRDADAVGVRSVDPESKTWLEHILRLAATPAEEEGRT